MGTIAPAFPGDLGAYADQAMECGTYQAGRVRQRREGPALAAAASWWAFVLRYEAREMWRALPGPWWVKVLLIVITQAIPGPQDEILLLLIVAAFRKRQARKARAAISESA